MMLLNDERTHEAMINVKTGKRFWRELTREEQFRVILCVPEDYMSAETKLEKLTALGYSMEEIFEAAMRFPD